MDLLTFFQKYDVSAFFNRIFRIGEYYQPKIKYSGKIII